LSISMIVNMLDGMKRVVDPDVRLLQAAADPTRLAILRQLAGGGGVCACDFTACCEVAQPTISHHLRVLREAGWVRTERRGSNIHYFLLTSAVERFAALAGDLVAPRVSVAVLGVRPLPVIQPRA
jgi:ArsR family transcriptional regulator, arsenate/arsenite/antimonite-responsive transcriptional repressor